MKLCLFYQESGIPYLPAVMLFMNKRETTVGVDPLRLGCYRPSGRIANGTVWYCSGPAMP
jgi:hypothetical protein